MLNRSRRIQRRCFSSLASAFEEICNKRYAAHAFEPNKPIPNDVIHNILRLTQSAPSSFNLQPYKIIIVKDIESLNNLGSAMLGANKNKVISSSFTAVFASYKDPTKLTRKVMDLETDAGKPKEYISTLPSKIHFLFSRRGILSSALKKLGAHLISPIEPSPKIYMDNSAWSHKNTALAAQNMMLAATSMGLSTAPMEGYDERRICFELDIPIDHFSIPLVVSVGYEKHDANNSNSWKRARFPMEDVCYLDKYGVPFQSDKSKGA